MRICYPNITYTNSNRLGVSRIIIGHQTGGKASFPKILGLWFLSILALSFLLLGPAPQKVDCKYRRIGVETKKGKT